MEAQQAIENLRDAISNINILSSEVKKDIELKESLDSAMEIISSLEEEIRIEFTNGGKSE